MRLLNRILPVAATALALTACVSDPGADVASPRPAGAPSRAASGVSDTPVVIGSPYSIGGRSYTPVDQIDYDEVGYASWYGSELAGRPTANGEAFRPEFVTAAHRTLPLPSYVEVTRLDTGRTILVRINDRGPADPNRLIDLSAAAAEQLGISEAGMVQVRVRRTTPPESERATLRAGQPALPRIDTPDSLLEILRERAGRLPRPTGYAPRPGNAERGDSTRPNAPVAGAGGYIVQVAAFSSRARADALAARLGAQVVSAGNIHRVRFGPFATQAEAAAAVDRARSLGQPGAIIQRER